MNYFAVLKGILMDVTMDLVRRNVMQVSDIVRQKFQPDADYNKMYKVSANSFSEFSIIKRNY
jgi:hypothetical protein